nr:hypothetical protein [Tanacetum cinerariifolium]
RKEIQTKGVIGDPIYFDTLGDIQEFVKMLVSIFTRKSMKFERVLNFLNHVILKSKIRCLNCNRGNWATPTIQCRLAQLLHKSEVGNWWITVSVSGHFEIIQESRINTRSFLSCKLGIIKRIPWETINPSGGMMCQGVRKEIQTKGVIGDPIYFDTLGDIQEFVKMLVSIFTRKSMKFERVLNFLNHVILKSKIRCLNCNRGNWATPTIQCRLAQLLHKSEVGNWWITVSVSGHFEIIQESRINTRSFLSCKLGIIKR